MAYKKQFTFLFVLCCLLFCSPFLVYGQKPLSRWTDLKFIKTDELKKVYDGKEDFLLVNTLSPIEFNEMAIKGSINIPYDLIKQGEASLPENKSKKLIFYCKGPK